MNTWQNGYWLEAQKFRSIRSDIEAVACGLPLNNYQSIASIVGH